MRSSPHGGGPQGWRACHRGARTLATIICAVDNSPGSSEASRVAGELSGRFDVRLVLAHAADGWTSAEGSLSTIRALEGGGRLLEQTAREHNLAAERRVEVGEPAEVLARIAAEERATLILVGSRHKGRRRRQLHSRVAEDLAVTAPCPVVVVPPPPR
jgi:nucleotide-binding universal stress UspA family protein